MADAIQVSIDITPSDILQKAQQFFHSSTLIEILNKIMTPIAARLAGRVVKNQLSGQALKNRTGILSSSITGLTIIRGGLPAITVGVFRGPALAYAAVQEFGTVGAGGRLPTIKPKRAKALAIPIGSGALTPAGVSKFQSPRDYVGPGKLQFIPGKTSIGVLVDDVTDEAQYVLAAKVDIPPAHYLLNEMLAALPSIAKQIAKGIEIEFARAVA